MRPLDGVLPPGAHACGPRKLAGGTYATATARLIRQIAGSSDGGGGSVSGVRPFGTTAADCIDGRRVDGCLPCESVDLSHSVINVLTLSATAFL